MRSTVVAAIAAVAFFAAAPVWAQSLTPITGWVPLDSAKAKTLMRDSPVPSHAEPKVSEHAAAHENAPTR